MFVVYCNVPGWRPFYYQFMDVWWSILLFDTQIQHSQSPLLVILQIKLQDSHSTVPSIFTRLVCNVISRYLWTFFRSQWSFEFGQMLWYLKDQFLCWMNMEWTCKSGPFKGHSFHYFTKKNLKTKILEKLKITFIW